MKKKTILIVHGWMHSKERYRRLKEDLEKNEMFEVTLYEFSGFGKSKPEIYFNILQHYKKNIKKLLQERKFDYVIGHSMGGNILLRAMSEIHCRSNIVLLSPEYNGIHILKPLTILYPMLGIVMFCGQKIRCSITDFFIKCTAFLTINKWEKIDNLIIEDVRQASTLVALNTMMELTWDCWRIDKKTWNHRAVELIIGEYDRIISRNKIKRLIRDVGDVKVHMINRIGHTAVVENYEELLKILLKIFERERSEDYDYKDK